MARDRIAIACQGGGSQTAFTAGVLISLFNRKIHEEKQIVGLSGTSGGAVCAALAWSGLLKWSQGEKASLLDNLEAFWRDNGTEDWLERVLNDTFIRYLELVDHGLLMEWKTSPYSTWRQGWNTMMQLFLPHLFEFYDLEGLLKRHFDFKALGKLARASQSPVLVIGAVDVITGAFKKFNSRRDAIDLQVLMASMASPSLIPAVETRDSAYWDGLFSDNPPTDELIDYEIVGDRLPDQLWVIQINPTGRKRIPRTPAEIIDRRNELIGNVSLFQDLRHICRVNKWLERGAFTKEYSEAHHLQPVDIFILQMPEALQERLDYASKLDRNEHHIRELIEAGKTVGRRFVDHPASMRLDCHLFEN